MHLLTEHRGRKVRRLGLLVAITVAALAITGSASAIPYRAIAWGDGVFGQLGTGNQASTNTPVGAGMTLGVAGVAAGGQGGSLGTVDRRYGAGVG